jgi:alpha-amylase
VNHFLWSENEDYCSENTYWIHAQFSTNQTIVPLFEQKKNSDSIYNHYHSLISLRKTEPALSQIFAPNLHRVCLHDNQLLAYFRPHIDKSLVIIHNLSSFSKTIQLPDDKADFNRILFSTDENHSNTLTNHELGPHKTLILSAI